MDDQFPLSIIEHVTGFNRNELSEQNFMFINQTIA